MDKTDPIFEVETLLFGGDVVTIFVEISFCSFQADAIFKTLDSFNIAD